MTTNIEERIDLSEKNIVKYQNKIAELLVEAGIAESAKDVKIQIGPELEFYTVGGKGSYLKRLLQLVQQALGQEIPEKDDSFIPKKGRAKKLDEAFDRGVVNRVHIDKEPAEQTQIALERTVNTKGNTKTNPIAFFQTEVVSPPRSPIGVARWFEQIGQVLIDNAQKYGLKRVEIVPRIHEESSTSGIHLNFSISVRKNGEWINLFTRDNFEEEKNKYGADKKAVSKLALAVAYKVNEFLKDGGLLIFAPTQDEYDRRFNYSIVGPKNIGVEPRKKRGSFRSIMFRGNGRESFREEDKNGTPDSGEHRIEARMVGVTAMGHPNKKAYPSQRAAPYEMIEALLYTVTEGVEAYVNKEKYPETEEKLYKIKHPIPLTVQQAVKNFRNSEAVKKIFGDRVEGIIERGQEHQEILYKDRSPYATVIGQQVKRLLATNGNGRSNPA
jgi:hypothetical protein